jgi:CubicO group peptidase (beta-lactamase class C family)
MLVDVDADLREQSRRGRFSGAVCVSQRGHILLDQGYGTADCEQGRPNTPQTAFQIASISKQFTAAAVLLLQERGVLSVHDRLCARLAGCPPAWEPITLHHLLTHTSGLGHWRDFPTLSLYEPLAPAAFLSIVQAAPLLFAPGARWAYSSPGYVLLARLVEQRVGTPLAAFLAHTIFDPLGMTSTGVGTVAPQPPHAATGYSGGHRTPVFDLDSLGTGTGDIWSTTEDLARWDTALMAGNILGPELLRTTSTPHAETGDTLPSGEPIRYGYGWFLAALHGHQLVFHPGDNAGFHAFNACLPDDEAAVIVLTNDENIDTDALGLRLVQEVLR